MAGAIIPERALVGLLAVDGQIDFRFRRGLQQLCGSPCVDRNVILLKGYGKPHVCDLEQLLKLQRTVEHIVSVQHHQIGPGDMQAALLQHIFLIRHIRDIDRLVV